MIFLGFAVLGIVIYLMNQQNKIRKEKRELFKIHQQNKLDELMKKAREQDKKKEEQENKENSEP